MWRRNYVRSLSHLVYAMAASVGVMSFPVSEPKKTHGFSSRTPATSSVGSPCQWNDRHVTTCEAVRHPSIEEDYELMKIDHGCFADGHAIFGLLLGENMIEKYDVYKRPEGSRATHVIVAHVKFGDKVDGHPGMVHGGILSLILDDFLGFGFKALGVPMAVTANLNVDFRAPVFAGTEARIQAQLEHREGRKLYWKVQMMSMDDETLYAECTSLYIIPRSHDE